MRWVLSVVFDEKRKFRKFLSRNDAQPQQSKSISGFNYSKTRLLLSYAPIHEKKRRNHFVVPGWCLFHVSLYLPSSRQHNTINLKAKKRRKKHKVTSTRLHFSPGCFVCKDIFLVIWLALFSTFICIETDGNCFWVLFRRFPSFVEITKQHFSKHLRGSSSSHSKKKWKRTREKNAGDNARRAHESDGVGLRKWWKLIFCDFVMQSSFTRRTSFKAPFNDVASLSLCLCFFSHRCCCCLSTAEWSEWVNVAMGYFEVRCDFYAESYQHFRRSLSSSWREP